MTDKLVFALDVSEREFNTILAALRHYQETVVDRYDPNEDDIATNGGSVVALGVDEIDTLCERINGGTCQHQEHEDHLICQGCGECREDLNDDDWCPDCSPKLHYIIINKYNTPIDYWSNEDGWSHYRDSSTLFTEDERKTLQTPVDGAWVQLLDEDVVTCNCGESFTCSDGSDWDAWENHAQNCDLHMPDLTD